MSTSLSGTSGLPRVLPGNAAASLASAATGTAAATPTPTTGLSGSRQTIAQNFDAFLQLLTTQLRNQSPLDPLDANQFTQQLVQFSGVEQQLRSNDLLTTISKNVGSGGTTGGESGKLSAAAAAALIGIQVTADGSTARLRSNGVGGNSAQFPVTVPAGSSNLQVQIRNSKGEDVYQAGWTPLGTGNQPFIWNGVRANGTAADVNESYTISVVAENALGQKGLLSTERTGTVSAVDLTGTEAQVQFNGLSIPLSQIRRVARVGG